MASEAFDTAFTFSLRATVDGARDTADDGLCCHVCCCCDCCGVWSSEDLAARLDFFMMDLTLPRRAVGETEA